MVKIALIGACGRMGKECIEVIKEDNEIKLVSAIERKNHPLIGKQTPIENIYYLDDLEKITELPDIIVDFSTPFSTITALSWAEKNKIGACIGTTGFTEEEILKIKDSSKKIPILLSPNMSTGVNIFFEIVSFATKLLHKKYDKEIIEIHHRYKKDAPSGTAKRIGEIISEKIPIHSLRGGGVVGEHTVLFLGENDRIEITHKAQNRRIFAEGAIFATKWLKNKLPGFYTMRDVIKDVI